MQAGAAPKELPLRNNQLRRRSEDLRVCPWRIHRSEQIGVQEVVERLVDRESPRAVGHFGAGLVLRKRLIATRTAAGIPIRRFDQMAISPTGQAVLHGCGRHGRPTLDELRGHVLYWGIVSSLWRSWRPKFQADRPTRWALPSPRRRIFFTDSLGLEVKSTASVVWWRTSDTVLTSCSSSLPFARHCARPRNCC